MTEENDDNTEFTRIQAKVQVGSGVDQRGEITVETQREVEEATRFETVELPGGTVVEDVPINDEAFAEWYLELQRGKQALLEELLLDESEVGGDG